MSKFKASFLPLCFAQLMLCAQNFQVRTYNEDAGLTAGVVVSMAQANDGRIWFSGRGSLMIYDSKSWLELRDDMAPPTKVDQIASDHRGDIWASSFANEIPLMRFHKDKWEAFSAPPGYISSGGDPYCLAVARFGDEPVAAVAPNRSGFWTMIKGVWTFYGEAEGLGQNSANSLDGCGESIYISGSSGLFRLDADGLKSLNHELPVERRQLQAATPEIVDGQLRRLWLMGNGWLGVLENHAFTFVAQVPQVPDVFFGRPVRILADGCGGIFFGSATDLHHLRLDTPGLRTLGAKSGLITDGVIALMKDQEQNFWVSSPLGVSKISSMRFANFNKAHGLPDNEVTAIEELPNGDMVFAQESGFSVYDGRTITPLKFAQKKEGVGMRPFFMHAAADGSIWAAVMNLGILKINPDRTIQLMTRPDSPFVADLLDVLPEADGTVWVGIKGGLRQLRQGELVEVPGVPKINTAVRHIYRSKGGSLMLGCANLGLFQTVGNDWIQVKGPDLDSSSIFGILEDSSGRTLVGTQAGLYILENQSLKRLAEYDQIKQTVYFLIEDRQARIWLGTDKGVLRLESGKIQSFSTLDGLQALETNRGGGFLDRHGRVWIGSDRGVSVYQEAYDFENQPPSNLSITDIEASGVPLDIKEPLRLQPDQNDLNFKFSVVTFQGEEGLTFQSWLEGYDKGWLAEYKSDSRAYRYTNLPPGHYRFHIKVHRRGGLWSDEVSSPPVEIAKPFWARIWFLTLLMILMMGICWSIFEFLSSKRYSRFLEKQVAERTLALSRKTDQLEERIQASRTAEREIQVLNEDLEERVRERTVALELAQRDLVENAHYAGMAEIANSILHNVGNILNSVSTSGYLIRQTLLESKMSAILKANELLSENLDQLEHFLIHDPRGKQLIKFYISLGEVHVKERDRLVKHASLLMEKIDAIKDVVAQQHNYASGVYQNEELDPRDLIETAIKIIETGFFNHSIVLRKDYRSGARVMIQKTKFIHTMVNLLKNAKESIMSVGGDSRLITITVENKDDFVVIHVSDTGMGIPIANLQKIFNHGFTTKKNGHGFGLHSSANAIQEMGGAMWAESRGEGQGATFVIRLPMVRSEVLLNAEA